MRQRGFTLLELLITVLVFSLLMVAVYQLFDQGTWLSLHTDRRVNLQDMGRLTIEQMERDIRMIGVGCPGQQDSANRFWTPYIFRAKSNEIGFAGDVDNGNSLLKADYPGGAAQMTLESIANICPGEAIVIDSGKSWGRIECSSASNPADMSVTSGTVPAVTAAEGEVTTPELVLYRLTPDADNDGVCDATEEPFCNVERAEISGNTPPVEIGTIPPNDSDWQQIATSVKTLKFEYFRPGVNGVPTLMAIGVPADGLTGPDLYGVSMIRVTLQLRGRSWDVQEFQDYNLSSDVLVRDVSF